MDLRPSSALKVLPSQCGRIQRKIQVSLQYDPSLATAIRKKYFWSPYDASNDHLMKISKGIRTHHYAVWLGFSKRRYTEAFDR